MPKLDWNTVLNFTHCVCGAKKPKRKGCHHEPLVHALVEIGMPVAQDALNNPVCFAFAVLRLATACLKYDSLSS